MLDVHINDFWKDCAAILLSGLRHFPRQQTLYIEDISGPDDMDEFGLHSPRHLAALGAVQWLKDEGFIRFSHFDKQESVDEFVLCAKAFSRLLQQQDGSALFQTLEYAFLQKDSAWLERLMQQFLLEHSAAR
ncbi:MAG: hypothetical protein RL217_2078 [Pseudomonadota bacterium]|jgi:hypothetical protein